MAIVTVAVKVSVKVTVKWQVEVATDLFMVWSVHIYQLRTNLGCVVMMIHNMYIYMYI